MGTDLRVADPTDPRENLGWDLTFHDTPGILTLLGPEFLGDPAELRQGIRGRRVGYERRLLLGQDGGKPVFAAVNWLIVADWRTFKVPPEGGLILVEPEERAALSFLAPTDWRVTQLLPGGLAVATKPVGGYSVRLLPGLCKRKDPVGLGDKVYIDACHADDKSRQVAGSWTFDQSPPPAKPKREPKPGMVEVVVSAMNQEKGFVFGWHNGQKVLFHPNQYQGEDPDRICVGTRLYGLIESDKRGYRVTQWYEA